MSEVTVNLGDRSYVITIGQDLLERIGSAAAAVRKPSAALIVSNPVVARLYAGRVKAGIESTGVSCAQCIIPAGERFKTLKSVTKIYEAALDAGLDRASAIVALGGGVVGDMAGFAAATYMRGIDYYQVPTTLLAQVDSSIGGKTGVDLPRGKNLVGAFHQPRAVLIDIDTLRTLPARELRCGLAEVVKHAIIYDRKFAMFLEGRAADLLARQPEAIREAVTRSIEIKRDVVQQDERESGLRAILNYGHTVGHAIEVVGGYGRYRHGEASAIGMVTEAILAERIGVAEKQTARHVAGILAAMRLPVRMDPLLGKAELLDAMRRDKKAVSGKFRLALPTRVGACEICKVEPDALAEAIESHRVWGG